MKIISKRGIKIINNLRGYSTFNYFSEENPDLIKKIEIDENIFFDYREDPSYMNWIGRESDTFLVNQRKPTDEEIIELNKDFTRAYELIIYAESEIIAQNVCNLIHGGRLLSYPSITENPEPRSVVNIKFNFIPLENFKGSCIYEQMFLACLVAAKSWKRKELIYSIEKYRFSLQLDSITPHSASPRYGQVFSIEDRGYSYHVNSAYAFLSAYSIIEELGLEIRSSNKKHRFIENEWNPGVKEDIIHRLSEVGINEFETIDWVIRGTPSELYNEIKPKLGIDSDWNDKEIIHDRKMKIYDAIHYSSYIRNFFIGHRFDKIVLHINPYDVHNIQRLARRLILGKLRLWKILV